MTQRETTSKIKFAHRVPPTNCPMANVLRRTVFPTVLSHECFGLIFFSGDKARPCYNRYRVLTDGAQTGVHCTSKAEFRLVHLTRGPVGLQLLEKGVQTFTEGVLDSKTPSKRNSAKVKPVTDHVKRK